jgi:hypothetical protein
MRHIRILHGSVCTTSRTNVSGPSGKNDVWVVLCLNKSLWCLHSSCFVVLGALTKDVGTGVLIACNYSSGIGVTIARYNYSSGTRGLIARCNCSSGTGVLIARCNSSSVKGVLISHCNSPSRNSLSSQKQEMTNDSSPLYGTKCCPEDGRRIGSSLTMLDYTIDSSLAKDMFSPTCPNSLDYTVTQLIQA